MGCLATLVNQDQLVHQEIRDQLAQPDHLVLSDHLELPVDLVPLAMLARQDLLDLKDPQGFQVKLAIQDHLVSKDHRVQAVLQVSQDLPDH